MEDVPRVSAGNLSVEDLFNAYILPSRPVLIERAHEWPARLWSCDILAATHGDMMVAAAPLPPHGHNCWFDDAAAWGMRDGSTSDRFGSDGADDDIDSSSSDDDHDPGALATAERVLVCAGRRVNLRLSELLATLQPGRGVGSVNAANGDRGGQNKCSGGTDDGDYFSFYADGGGLLDERFGFLASDIGPLFNGVNDSDAGSDGASELGDDSCHSATDAAQPLRVPLTLRRRDLWLGGASVSRMHYDA